MLKSAFKPHADALVFWYQKNHRSFPWREDPNPYWVWLAEVMSQQTRMTALLPYFYRFTERFLAVEALAAATEAEVLAAWSGLGYYSRARNLHKAARAIAKQGRFPKSAAEWLELPGVGPYTAAAIASQTVGERVAVFDGNVLRVCSRFFARADARAPSFRDEMVRVLRQAMQDVSASDFNQALMELGSEICTPRSPDCVRCPIQDGCQAYQKGKVNLFPPAKPRREFIALKPRVFVEMRGKGGRRAVRLHQRPRGSWFGGMWDFSSELGSVKEPVVKQSKPAAAVRLGEVHHSITHHKIEFEVFQVNSRQTKGQWVDLDDLASGNTVLPIATTARKVLRLLFP